MRPSCGLAATWGNHAEHHQAGWKIILPLTCPGPSEMLSTWEVQQRDMSLLWQRGRVLSQHGLETPQYHPWYSTYGKLKKQVLVPGKQPLRCSALMVPKLWRKSTFHGKTPWRPKVHLLTCPELPSSWVLSGTD